MSFRHSRTRTVRQVPNNPHYRALMAKARAEHLANIESVSDELRALYTDAAHDMSAKAKGARKGSLTRRWAREYERALRERTAQLAGGMYRITYQGMRRSASLPPTASGDFFDAVGGQSFRDVFARTPDEVLAEMLSGGIYKDKQGLSARIWGVATGLEEDVDYMINRALAEHRSAKDLARDIERYVEGAARKPWDFGKVYPNLRGKVVDYNAQRLARTSINHAYFLSSVKSAAHNPFVRAMHWQLSASHYERQIEPFGRDCCDDYAEHDEGLGTGNYPPESLPLPHPQCLCAQYAVIPESLEEIGDELGAWLAGGESERLDAWYEREYGEERREREQAGAAARDLRRANSTKSATSPSPPQATEAVASEALQTQAESAILTDDDIGAITEYISATSYTVNAKLRSQMQLSEEESAFVRRLDAALEKLPDYVGTVYRSIRSADMENFEAFDRVHQVGERIMYLAYTSASNEIYDESMDIQFVITSKRGKDMREYNPNEKEILFHRGTTFTVARRDGNTIYLEEE